MLPPNKNVLSALAALEGNPNFETVRMWLAECREDLNENVALTRDDVTVRWQQGSMQALDEILKAAATARATLNRSR